MTDSYDLPVWRISAARLKAEIDRRGWDAGRLAETLRRWARWRGHVLPLDAVVVRGWLDGRSKLTRRQLDLLAEVLESSVGELIGPSLAALDAGAASSRPAIVTGGGNPEVRRREFLRHVASLAGATILDSGMWPLAPGRWRIDRRVVDSRAAMTRHLAAELWDAAPRTLLPLVSAHMHEMRLLLQGAPPDLGRRLQQLIGESALLAGRLARNLENLGDAKAYWTLAEAMGSESGDASIRATSLIERVYLHSIAPFENRGGDIRKVMGLLDAAEACLDNEASPSLRAWLLGKRAEEFATCGNGTMAHRELDQAERALARARGEPVGLLAQYDHARVELYRGSVEIMLRRPNDAISALDRALAGSTTAHYRSAALNDLAAAHLQKKELEQACECLRRALAIAVEAQLPERLQSISAIRRLHLARWAGEPAVKQLDDRLSLVT